MTTMHPWYAHLTETDIRTKVSQATAGDDKHEKKSSKHKNGKAQKVQRPGEKAIAKAHTRDSLQALSKLGERVDGQYRIVSQPPVLLPARDLALRDGLTEAEVANVLTTQFQRYRTTLQDDRRRL